MMTRLIALSLALSTFAFSQTDPRLAGATRSDQDGWIKVHLQGPPSTLGFQHGYLLAPEIDDALKMLAGYLKGASGKDWDMLREAAGRMFRPKLGEEYAQELEGIAEGVRSRGYRYDSTDLLVLNGFTELAWYYLPGLEAKQGGPVPTKAPGNCSAFIATGGMTKDGRPVMAHNNWVDYAWGSRWTIAWDLQPAKGHRIVMDGFPGKIDSGDDFALNDAGLLITETTITGYWHCDWTRTPEFVRGRRAAQYADSIDSFARIMAEDSNGALANTWLVGDLKTNEIAKLDLGLTHQKLWRTKDGVFTGSNYPTDEALRVDETHYDPSLRTSSPEARKARWEQLMAGARGKLDADLAMAFLADHGDALEGKPILNRHALCGHLDRDPVAAVEWADPPFDPMGAVTGKVTTAALAKSFTFWGRAGHPCGTRFDAAAFLEQHPEFRWQASFLKDLKSQPWSLVAPGK